MAKVHQCKVSSRKIMVYAVIFLWFALGVFVSFFTPHSATGAALDKIKLVDLATYFISLTGFVGTFIYGETVKSKEWTTPLFMKGKTDSREIIVYASIFLWLISGVYGIIWGVSLTDIGTYFAALTPFVAGYVIGETSRSSSPIVSAAAAPTAPVTPPTTDPTQENSK